MYYPYDFVFNVILIFLTLLQQSIGLFCFKILKINKIINFQVRFVFHCMVDREATDAAVEKVVQVIETFLKSK